MLLAILFFGITTICAQNTKTLVPSCSEGQFLCWDGTCIPLSSKCNGTVECVDGSDESFPSCRKNECNGNQFKCTYGGCVNFTATCDDVKDCADNSDELLPICRNDVDRNICSKKLIDGGISSIECLNSRSNCDDGQSLSDGQRCNGKVDCTDGTDESLSTCADAICNQPLFRCAYGGCAHENALCDGIIDCADGSDETDEVCGRIVPGTVKFTTTTAKPVCILPPYPEHGTYIVGGVPDAAPGQTFDVVYLNVTCDPEYGILGDGVLYCFSALWSSNFPKCVRFCKLNKHPSVDYNCLISGNETIEGHRQCESSEPDGTVVKPVCRTPNYYYSGILFYMHCVDGAWDNIAVCTPECGKVTPEGEELIIGGSHAMQGELPWHAGIYRKDSYHSQICGGSIVSTTVIVSAAQCFWSNANILLPPSRFAVAVGKLYRRWNSPLDNAQKSDVRDIKVPDRFRGTATNFQDDIALVIVFTPFEYTIYVRPVCVDFDYEFDTRQLVEDNVAKIAGWGLTSENGTISPLLKVVDMSYINIGECIQQSPADFQQFITSDKICAGSKNGSALCLGDSGGGLSFPEQDRGNVRYYLRGIASTAPRNDKPCNAYTFTTFTQLQKFEHFIKEYL